LRDQPEQDEHDDQRHYRIEADAVVSADAYETLAGDD
jgi:hypothetical protein